jgi:hypothetical protein
MRSTGIGVALATESGINDDRHGTVLKYRMPVTTPKVLLCPMRE